MKNLRRLTTLIASLALATSLAACSGSGSDGDASPSGAVQTSDETTASSTPEVVPDSYKADLVRIISGDTIVVEPTEEKLQPSNPANTTGEVLWTDIPEDEREQVTMRISGITAPAEGECGFEDSRAALAVVLGDDYNQVEAREGRLLSLTPWSEGEDKTLQLDRVSDGRTSADGLPVWDVNMSSPPYIARVSGGYATIDETADIVTQARDQETAQEDGLGLWATCWAQG